MISALHQQRRQTLLFIHGAGGAVNDPQYGSAQLLRSLKQEFARDFRIRAPLMPHPKDPHAVAWLDSLEAELSDFPARGVLVGHSMGGSMILKLISERRPNLLASGLVMIACPFWGEPDWKVEEFYLPKDFPDRVSGLKRILLYHSRDDAIVPFSHMATWHQHLPHAEVYELDGVGHTFATGIPRVLVDGLRSLASGHP